ncbi:MAG: carbohydrate kinase family protein [Bacteroidetes bacterium]|nr:carbohydrate kinase family protein [Bacteroidota bacterium]
MTILVLGHLVLDEIHSYDGKVYHSPGGIAFPLTAFSAVTKADDSLLPVFPYGIDAVDAMRALRVMHPAIDARRCWEVPDQNTRVRLFHVSAAEYNTQLVRSLGPIPWDRIEAPLAAADLVYLNMMTGHDISLETAARLRGGGRLVYIDLHMIAYRVHADGRRERAPAEQWMKWVSAGDVLQCNEHEFAALIPTDGGEAERLHMLFEVASPRHVIITRGEAGADIFSAPETRLHVDAISPRQVVDPTGCGDAFGSTLAMGLARGEALTHAAGRAAQAASYVAGIPGSLGMEGLRAHLGRSAA